MKKLPFIHFITPVLKASYSIRQKEQEWRSIHENASLIIAPSNAIARNMIINGANAEKIKVLTHGIPLPKSLTDNVTIAPEKPLQFFYVGRICYVKGVHIMLAAFNGLKVNAELHIIGGAGNRNEERYLRRLKKKYKNDTRIKWQGKVNYQSIYDDIIKYDVMIHPTICLEIFGLNVAEALALGKPVIATKCGGPEMQIRDGVNGILVEPNNIVELTNAIERMVSEKINLEVKNESVKSIEIHVQELLKAYEEAAN